MDLSSPVKYTCPICLKNRTILANPKFAESQISQSGVTILSDIHKCKDGFTQINNLSIDANNDVRGVKTQQFSQYNPQVLAIPVPAIKATEKLDHNITISSIDPLINLSAKISLYFIDTDIIIGNIKDEGRLHIISQPNHLCEFILYNIESNEPVNDKYIMDWIAVLANALEILPVVRVGFIIDALKYIIDQFNNKPVTFDKQMVMLLLDQHEIIIESNADISDQEKEKSLEKLKKLFGEENMVIVNGITKLLEQRSYFDTGTFFKSNAYDPVHNLYALMHMERYNLIKLYYSDIIFGE